LKVLRETSVKILEQKKVAADASGKDMIDILMRSNQTADARNKLSDAEVTGNLTTFLFAGHETSAGTLTWCLYELARNQDAQDRLRKEVQAAYDEAISNGLDNFSLETITNLPYLDAVIKEILRFRPAAFGTSRQASHDDVIPLSKPLRLRDGTMADSFEVKKGDMMTISIIATNRSKDLYGPDAGTFNPSYACKVAQLRIAYRLTGDGLRNLLLR